MSDLISPFEKFRQESPYCRRAAVNSGRFRDELVALLRERAEQIKPSPIDTDRRHAKLLEFIEYVQHDVHAYDARLAVLQRAIALNDGAIGGEMRAIIGAILKDTDPAVAFNDLICAAYDDATVGVRALREHFRAAEVRAEDAEKWARELMGRISGLEAERDEQAAAALELSRRIERDTARLRFEPVPGEPVPEPEPESVEREKTPMYVYEHGGGYRYQKRSVNGGKPGQAWPTVEEAVAELEAAEREQGKQAADERLRSERGVAA